MMIPVIWLLVIVAADMKHRFFADGPESDETWHIENLQVEGNGVEDRDSLRAIFELKAIPVNRAGEQLLMTVPGIGPELARRIVDQRRRSGRFAAPEELMKVAGIGPRRTEQFKHYLSFD